MKIEQKEIKRASGIVAKITVSISELQHIYPEFTLSETRDTSGKYAEHFLSILEGLGMNTSEFVREHLNDTHRNRFNQVVTCPRWVGEELTTDLWINSGYASRAAKDKASGSLLIEALYAQRGETEKMQLMLCERDKCTEVDKSAWVKE